ncbi:MAG TPA: heme exporter protein CcmB [Cytophagaceae bacterium]
MVNLREIAALVKKEALLEWRQRYALNGMMLYVGSTVFICYLSFGIKTKQLVPATWNALFWIILLFTAVNAIAKSFIQERQGRNLYMYQLASPQGIILSKILYNSLLMALLSFIGYTFYTLVLGNPIEDQGLFIINLLLGAFGFSTTLTMVSGIASKAANSSTLMTILSIPVLVPMLLILIKISKNAIDGLERSLVIDEVVILMSVNMMLIAVSYLLFPYLWRS